jgi:protein MpaA
MRAHIPENHMASPFYEEDFHDESGTYRRLLQPLLELAENSDYLLAGSVGLFSAGQEEFRIPRFIFMGPKGGGDTIRLGLFSALHGDETEGTEALIEFFQELELTPELAKGFHLYAYPVCNPGGFSVGTPNNLAGLDLTGEFWRKSSQPEAYYLERELGVHGFQGVISLHAVKLSSRFLASCRSSILDTALVQPAIQATRAFVPGLAQATGGNEDYIPTSFLTATDELRPVPFEINLGIPRRLPGPSRIHGTVAALKSLLNSYRTLKAFRQNI